MYLLSQLLSKVTVTSYMKRLMCPQSALLLDDALLKRVVTEVVLLDISQGSVATHLKCGGIFNDSIIKFFAHSDSENRKLVDV